MELNFKFVSFTFDLYKLIILYSATERLVARARHLVDTKKEDGFAALHLAALNGHKEVAAILLSQNGGRAKVDLRNNRRQTPLHLATSQGHWSIVELLVHAGADIGSTDEDGDTVLHIAIAKSPNQQTAVPTPESSRDSPLIYAVRKNLQFNFRIFTFVRKETSTRINIHFFR